MKLSDVLSLVADYLNIDNADLAAYAEQDGYGGRDTGWELMSMTRDEGRLMYALARALQPSEVIEVGSAQGCSTTHFLQAIVDNGSGIVTSIDPDSTTGRGIPEPLREHWRHYCGDGKEIMPGYSRHVASNTIVLEDSTHQYEHTLAMLQAIKEFNPRLIICHDILEYPAVDQAWREVFGDNGLIVRVNDTVTGLALYAPEANE